MTYWGTSTGSVTYGGYGMNVVMQPMYVGPVRVGGAPAKWSTCTDLVPDPVLIHDGNTYYRSLGFSWPFRGITRKMLRKAYKRLGGPDDYWLTYCLKQLIDKDFRRLYDRMPFGHQAMDQFLWEQIQGKAKRVVAEYAMKGTEVDLREVLESWGIRTVDAPSEETVPFEPVVDDGQPLAESVQNDEELSGATDTVPEPWPWGYYVWRSSCQDTERLERWQHLLLAASRDAGLRVRMSVGFIGECGQEWFVSQFDDQFVIFLHEAVEPTETRAVEAVLDVMRTVTTH